MQIYDLLLGGQKLGTPGFFSAMFFYTLLPTLSILLI